MSSDWIKMRCDLGDDPAVIGIAASLGISEFEVVGRLHCLWSWADRHTTDGVVAGATGAWIDRRVGQGFAAAMEAAGWLSRNCGVISFPGFDRHNGRTAKERAEDARRKRGQREPPDVRLDSGQIPENVRKKSGQSPDENRTRERVRETKPISSVCEREESSSTAVARANAAAPLPRQFLLPQEWLAEAQRMRPEWSDDDAMAVFLGFRDHAVATGAKREDWAAAWRKWVRDERRGKRVNGHGRAATPAEKRAKVAEGIYGKRRAEDAIDGTAERVS